MKKLLLVSSLVLALALPFGAFAASETPADNASCCGQNKACCEQMNTATLPSCCK